MNDDELAAFLDLPEANTHEVSAAQESARQYIHIRNWDRFQRYGDRRPRWLRLHLDLHRNDAYLNLTPRRRALLVGLWIEYATMLRPDADGTFTIARGIPHLTRTISQRLALRVFTSDLKVLNDAGFITISGTETVTLGDGTEPLEVRSKKLDKNLGDHEKPRPVHNRRKRKPPQVCPDCEVGGGLHAIDCPQAQPDLPFNGTVELPAETVA